MSASTADIKRLRRMVNEMDDANYNDTELAAYLESWELIDSNGRTSTNSSWIEGYDLHAAAADIWEEKASKVSANHDFSADGSSFSASQMYANFMNQAKHHRASQKARTKNAGTISHRSTYYPEYANPIFDEDEQPEWTDLL